MFWTYNNASILGAENGIAITEFIRAIKCMCASEESAECKRSRARGNEKVPKRERKWDIKSCLKTMSNLISIIHLASICASPAVISCLHENLINLTRFTCSPRMDVCACVFVRLWKCSYGK